MKVLHLSSERSWRGGERQIAYLIDGLRRHGVTSGVAVRKGSAFEQYSIANGFDYFPMPFKNSVDLATSIAIKRICAKEKFELIHAHSAKSQGVAVLAAIFGNPVPIVVSRRIDFVPNRSLVTRLKYNHHSIKSIVGVSEKVTEIMKAFVNKPERCVTIYDGVDPNRFTPSSGTDQNTLRKEYNLSADTVLIGNTSALAGHKDYFTFINTIARLRDSQHNLKAFIIGDGPMREELVRFVDKQGLTEMIVFTGFRNDIESVLPALDIFLMTSNEEGLGSSILDAYLAGVPVVATRAGGIPEIVLHEKTGLLADIADAETLAQNVDRIISEAPLRQRLVEGARAWVRRFYADEMVKQTIAVYEGILAQKSAS